MKELGANAIRVYHVDPNGDPDECMKALADAGIYLFVDLDDFPTQIEEQSPIWSQKQVDAFKLTLDELQKYGNTAGVFVGSEVFTVANDSAASPYFLAAARDIGAYRDSKDYRLVCREDESERLDSFASTQTGCNTVRPRDFDDLNTILGPEMTGTWSGALVYEWIEELNNYGLITYGKVPEGDTSNPSALDGFSRRGTPTPVNPDFTNLKSRFATLDPTGVALSDYSDRASEVTAPPCPNSTPIYCLGRLS
ncbi:1,3-beta-glucanosyltransferase [Blastomyces gilchristii SLH14081]|uniref:1,3-beta-glucanosyltransferase n=1 Tax=Blastomyces gilchristii (strain SLH14081) TaxID=559298 RepID=A0A179UGA3_BLAGS|nr:1,3-beta-glucanosyltransferase [Blastomyces gilchristii SLH14081]OAT07004.1 1,3-beta-glucanosyltransferase [Blastomyces gilchristii SLH14081]